MIEEILPNLYKIDVPLPDNPLKAINSYVIKSTERNLIIDTGMNREECMTVMHSGLKNLDVDLKRTDFFITHLHADHLGLVTNLATDTSIVYFNQPDADAIGATNHWEDSLDYASINGFPKHILREALERHPGYKYSPTTYPDFKILREGDIISVGDYHFKCVETPGHTRGHICLYEPYKKIFVSGDHILVDITPNISLWSDYENPLKEYLTSLDKVYHLDIELVLPGHRSRFKDYRGRIEELKHHHHNRTQEVLSILEGKSKDAFEIASLMTWDLTYDSWDDFPITQKWFAHGEALAHIKYLEEENVIQREMHGNKILYSIK